MNWTSLSETKNLNTLGLKYRHFWMMAAIFFVVATSLPTRAQQTQPQQSSLGDLARQARAQKQAQPAGETSAAQQVADELSEDQNDPGAPGGFKTYNAGDYKLWVPAPYIVEGHDDAGIVLAGPMVGGKRPMVLVGTPIVAHPENNDDAFHDAATQFAHLYTQSASCTKITVADHAAYECGLAAASLLGRRVSGNAVFVRGAANIYPVFCVTPSDSRSRDVINSSHTSYGAKTMARESLEHEQDDMKSVWQKCDSVFQSIHIRDANAAQKGVTASSKAGADAGKPAAASAAAAGVQTANAGNAGSLADVAHQLHQPPAGAAGATPQPSPVQSASSSSETAQSAEPAMGSTVPAGFKVQAFNYCKSATLCWDASVLVPADAKLISSDCKQYVFEIKVKGAPFLLLAGGAGSDVCRGRSANDPSQVQWKQLVDPETARAPGTSSIISAQQMTLEGQPAVITKMRFKNGFADWIAKRADVEDNGSGVVVGCLAPKDTFADGDAICSGLILSLRLP